MKRRHFIVTAAAAIGAASIPTIYYYKQGSEYNILLAQPQSLSLIWDAEAIHHIGTQYRTDFPGENSASSLVNLLDASPSVLNERITNDFKTGNTVLVDGWILSVTEARQCALASTVQSQ